MTPIMQQYRDAKERHPDMLLLFHVGDFYAIYGDDAMIAARVLGVTCLLEGERILTAESCLEGNLRKLLQAGHRVAICEPVEEAPKAAKVERVVTGNASPAW